MTQPLSRGQVDLAIVGAGAAGLMAAISAGREAGGSHTIALVDGAARLGAKILISGGGRCNVTNVRVEPADFRATNLKLVAKVLRALDVDQTVSFFQEAGVELKQEEETGKLFPATDRARTVLDALIHAARQSGVEIVHPWRVTVVERSDGMFRLHSDSGASLLARSLIIATGGRSVPKTGSDGLGYRLVTSLGHSVTATWPALVPLLLPQNHWMKGLSGISFEGELRILGVGGALVARRRGSVLLTHFGLSGPAILDISRDWLAVVAGGGPATLSLSFAPGESFEVVEDWLLRSSQRSPRLTVANLLRQRMPERLSEAFLRNETEISEGETLGRLTREARRKLAHRLTGLPLPVSGSRGFDCAEVTAGGVPLSEIETATMESRIVEGLFLCGEILDVDGRIGGFNFQWAWSSGAVAGRSAVRRLRRV